MRLRDNREGHGQASAAPNELSSGRHSLALAAWHLCSAIRGRRGASGVAPIWRARCRHDAGTLIPGHDVSGTGWQILGRAMQSITTMVPMWQCGHTRNDCPVSASKRSR